MIYFFLGRLRLAALLGLVGLGACQPESKQQAAPGTASAPIRPAPSPLEQRVLARHDSLMLATGRLFDLRRKLNARRPALVADSATHQALLHRLDAATRATVTADDAMTDWMHAYHRPGADASPDSVVAYFRQQQLALDHITALTQAAHDSAQAILNLTTRNDAPRQSP